MTEKKGKYGIYFMKGAFFFQLKEIEDNLVAIPLNSKNTQEMGVVRGEFESLKDALSSSRGKVINVKMQSLDYDYVVLAQGATSIYYLNTNEGIQRCDIELYLRDSE